MLAASGVGFAVILMFMQIGFRNALIDSNVQLLTLFDTEKANAVVVSRARFSMSTEQRFPRIILDKIAALPSVQSIGIVQIERGTARIQVERRPVRPIRVIAVDSVSRNFLQDRRLAEKLRSVDGSNACLVDRESKSFYHFAETENLLREQSMELNGMRLNAKGFFQLGTDFANDGSLLMSDRLHSQFFPWRWNNRRIGDSIDLALLNVQPVAQSSLNEAVASIQRLAPVQIEVLTTERFIEREKNFWRQSTPIGKIFFIGTLMGLIVGAIICYQIQFTDISNHMAEFATLKAMGYSKGYFWRFIFSQSIYLSLLGFFPGLLVSFVLYEILAQSSGLIMQMTPSRIFIVWLLTVSMCSASGALAIRKLFRSDPASLF